MTSSTNINLMDQPRVFTADEIEARVAVIRTVRETWKGKADYVATLDIEIWAMSTAARLLRAAAAASGDAKVASEMVEEFVATVEQNLSVEQRG